MLAIQGLKCIYDTGARGWAIELSLSGEGEESVRRFDVDGPDDADMLIDAFEESTASAFDPATGEIVFAYEYADFGIDDDEDDSDDEDGDGVSPDEVSQDDVAEEDVKGKQ